MKSLPLYDTILKADTEANLKPMKFTKLFILLLIVGVILRLITALWSFNFRENTDVLRYRDWATIAYLHDFTETYESTHLTFGTLPNNQPPGSIYILYSAYEANLVASKILLKILDEAPGALHWMNSSMINLFLRLPSIICDIILTILLYVFIKSKTNEKSALLASSIFILNPVIIYNSSFWGQMDSINNVLFFTSILLLLKKKITLGLIAYFLSLYIKLSLLFTFPFILLLGFLMLKKNTFAFIKSFCLSVLSILVLTLPISAHPWTWMFGFLSKNAVGEMQNITAFAFNFWWFIFKPTISIGKPLTTFEFSEIRLLNSPFSQQSIGPVSLEVLAFTLFSLLTIPFLLIILKMNRKKIQYGSVFLTLSLVCLIAFLFLPRMHERYIFPVFPLLATFIGLSNKKYLYFFLGFSILNFINLYLVWHPMLPAYIPYSIMINSDFQWSISALSILMFILFYTSSLRYLFSYEKK